jgi:hypothetical protein
MNAAIPILLSLAALPASTQVFHFTRVPEPNERAFTVLVPAGWRVSGGITRVNPMAANGALNSIGAKLDFSLSSPDGRILLRWYPETNYFDMRGNPAQAMFPPGSSYNGAPVCPKLNALAYLQQVVLRRAHPRASNVRVTGTYPLPKAAASYDQFVRQTGLPIQFRFDAALLTVQYREDGAPWEEALYSAVQDWGAAGAGLWTNKDTFSMRAPPGELEKAGRVVSVILNSVELNPRWVEGEIRGQIQRNEIAARTQQEIARLDREIVEHRRRTNAEIDNQMYHSLMGTEEYVNPITRKVEVGSNAWDYRWVNDRGETIYTDDPNFDPRSKGLTGYARSPVRKRFPAR